MSLKLCRYYLTNMSSSRILKIIFYFVHLIFSQDFGFIRHKSKKVRNTIKFFSVIQAFSGTLLCIKYYILPADYLNALWRSVTLLEYFSCVVVLLRSKHKCSFKMYRKRIQSLDCKLGVPTNAYETDMIMVIFIVVNGSLLIFNNIMYHIEYEGALPDYYSLFAMVPTVSGLFPCLVNVFLYYSTYRRMKTLRKNIRHYQLDMIKWSALYKHIIDSLESSKRNKYDALISISVMAQVPRLMLAIILILQYVKGHVNFSYTWTCAFLNIIEALRTLAVVSYATDLLASEVKRLQIDLLNKVLIEIDVQKVLELKTFVSYVKARPCCYRVCRVVPLGWPLLVLVLNICVTYIIVIVQFTHLY